MPTILVDGLEKKMACGPCIRGHRSTKCQHKDRVLLEVRKPGRPLTSCPHPAGSCSCERLVVNYTVPNKADCPCTTTKRSIVSHDKDQSESPRKPLTVKSSILEKALKTRNGSVQDALAGISTLSEGKPSAKVDIPTSDERESASRDASSQRDCSDVNDAGTSGDIKPLVSGNDLRLTERANVKPCCRQKADVSASAGALPIDIPSSLPPTVSNISHAEEQTAPLITLGDAADSAIEPSSGAADSATRSASPSTIKTKYDHHQHSPTLIGSNGLNASLQDAWALNGIHPAASPFWHHHLQPDNLTAPGQNPTSHIGMNGTMKPFMAAPPISYYSTSINPPLQHQCNCGETCQCLGCAQHPTNTRTTDYVRDTVKYMFTDEHGELCSPINRISTGQDFRMRRPSQIRVEKSRSGGGTFRKIRASNFAAHAASMKDHSSVQWPSQVNNQYPSTMPSAEDPMTLVTAMNDRHETFSRGGMDEQCIAVAEDGYDLGVFSPLRRVGTDNTNEDVDCLSPSAFYLQSFVIPGCSDMTGACLCGDGCTCAGCLTHNGHNEFVSQGGTGMGFPAAPATVSSASPSHYYTNTDPMAMARARMSQNGGAVDTTVPG